MSHPWMPLYIADYLADTGHLTGAEHGAYMLLIMRYWQDGSLPADERLLARFAKMTAEQWAESRDVLAALFEDGWRHKRIDEELAKATEIVGKRKAAAERSHASRGAKPKQEPSTCDASAEQVQVQATSKCSDTGVPPSPTPEEHPSPPSVVRPPRAELGYFLPKDWKPSQENIDWAAAQLGSMEAASDSFASFRDHWFAKPGKEGRKRDWEGTWRNWVREDVRRVSRNGNRGIPPASAKPSGLATSIAGLGAALAKRADSRLSDLHPEGPGLDLRAAPGGSGDDRRPRPVLVGEVRGPDRH